MPSTHVDLTVHLVFSTKNRLPYLKGELTQGTHAYIGGTLRRLGAVPLSIGGVEDHVHILVGIKATHQVSHLVSEVKKSSHWWLQREMGLTGFCWQEGYAAFSVSHERQEVIRNYIARQEEHHKKKTFLEELKELLELAKIEYNPEYLA